MARGGLHPRHPARLQSQGAPVSTGVHHHLAGHTHTAEVAVSHGALCPLALAQGNISKPMPKRMVTRNASASTAAGWVDGSWDFFGAGAEGERV